MHSLPTLENILARAGQASLIVDESGTVRFATDQACHLLKYAVGELRDQCVELLIPERFRLAHIGHRLRFTDDRRTRQMGAGFALFALCKDGSELPVEIGLDPVQRGLETLVILEIRLRESEPRIHSASSGR